MEQQQSTAQTLLAEKKIGGDIQVLIYDRSRMVAGDRWRLELVCEVKVPAADEYWPKVAEEDADIAVCIRREIGQVLTYRAEKIRNFIDQQEKNRLIAEMVGQLEENVLAYATKPDFPRKLFMRHYQLAKEKCLLAWHRSRLEDQTEEEEDSGPADFSHLFKD